MKYVFLLLFWGALFAERGIVVAANDRYAKELIVSLTYLRDCLHCTLPVEVWHAGDELSFDMQQKLCAINGVKIHDLMRVRGGDPKRCRGFQIKAFILEATQFTEVLLMDADVIFYEDPEELFGDPEYQRTGAFFFRDCRWQYMTKSQVWENSYERLDRFFQGKIEQPSASMPKEWRHHWEGKDLSVEHPIVNIYQEAGCVALDKARHKAGLQEIVKLNEAYEETYAYVWGDKETYWMGLEMAKEPYYVNEEPPWAFRGAGHKIVPIMQFVRGKLFYQQKRPLRPWKDSIFLEPFLGTKEATQEEKRKIFEAYIIAVKNI